MKKLLFQLDTDAHPAVFDTVVAYDGGADHVIGHGNVTPDNVTPLVEGCIFTRAPKEKKYTAIFVGGSDMTAGEKLFKAVQKTFFADFRVSVMLDSNGSNTTAAAAVARITGHVEVDGKRAVILAGTGPVGQRAAVMLGRAGARVTLTSRKLDRAEAAAAAIRERLGLDCEAAEAADPEACGRALEGAAVVLATGAAGVQLLAEAQWRAHETIEILVDANATPPAGIEGVEAGDAGTERHGRICYGALGFGGLKMKVHRACIARLFEANDRILDAEEIYAVARELR